MISADASKISYFLTACLAAVLIVLGFARVNCSAAIIGGNGESIQLNDGTEVGDNFWIPVSFLDGKATLGPFSEQDVIYFAVDFNQNHRIGIGDLFSFNSEDAIFSSSKNKFIEISWRDSPFYQIQVLPIGKAIEVLYWTYGCPLDLYYRVEDPPEAVPIPATFYLFGSGLIGLIGIIFHCRRSKGRFE